ncbi:MAG TPA: MogA/MoaB family molybdenum cofactor biosynthesis protein [Bacteroidales bacterium]|nr:MogA/MoaB family molybdenum cofactor biosynthesis protein [Bacteroidales bacterium]
MNLPGNLNILIITLSDRAYKGEYEDLSGPLVRDKAELFLKGAGWKGQIEVAVLPDEADMLKDMLLKSVPDFDIIFTTGGTGIGPRDITVETVRPLLSKEIPGIMEFIRVKYGWEKPNALLSRGVAGIINNTLIYTVPGSVRAAGEYMDEILKTLEHTIQMLHGIDTHKKH